MKINNKQSDDPKVTPCRHTSGAMVSELAGMKFELAGFLCLAVAAALIAPREWERGLAIGLLVGGMLAYIGKAVRRARLTKTFNE